MAKNPCDDINVLRVVVVLKEVLDVVFILVPIILFVLVMIDIAKNVIAKNEEDMGKNRKLAIKRCIYAVVVFFVPTIIRVFMNAIGDLGADYSSCMNITKDSLALKVEVEKSKCSGIDVEWNEGLSECVKKKDYTRVDPNPSNQQGHGGITVGIARDIVNSNSDYNGDSNVALGDFGGKFGLPLAGDSIYINSGYGPRSCTNCSKFHRGLDLKAVEGTSVYAVEGGIVVQAASMGARGNCIIVKHTDGLYTFYQHLSSMLKKSGDKVDKGMLIGMSGHTGGNYGPHLHFEVTKSVLSGTTAIDPCTYKDYSCTNGGKTGGYLSVK